jgi:hypothetical protein
MATARAAIAELGAVDADAPSGQARERPAIPLPERFPDAGEAEDVIPLPEHFPDANEAQLAADRVAEDARARASKPAGDSSGSEAGEPHNEADLHGVDQAAEALGATLDDQGRRVAARMVARLRRSAEFARERAALRRGRAVEVGLQRSRAARSPRRAARRASVAPSRDGPTPSEPPPAEHAPRSAGGASQ